MANPREVVIVNGARTAIGDYGGSLKDIPPTELGARVVSEALARSKVDPAHVGQCVFGHVIHTEAKDMYLSRVAAVKGGLPQRRFTVSAPLSCGSPPYTAVTRDRYMTFASV